MKYYFEIQFTDRTETHWTKSNSFYIAKVTMCERYKNAIKITFLKRV